MNTNANKQFQIRVISIDFLGGLQIVKSINTIIVCIVLANEQDTCNV